MVKILEAVTKMEIVEFSQLPGGGVLGLRTYGEVLLENLKSHPVSESNS